jgi:hypothetical protein
MRFRRIYIAAAGFALATGAIAIAQDATTQPAPTERPAAAQLMGNGGATSRPFENQYRNFRNNRRNNNGRNGQQNNQNNGASSQSTQQILYEQVGSRNIFVKGNQSTPETPVVQGGPSISADLADKIRLERQLVLTGVSLADNGKIALLEDHSDYSVREVKVGDSIANGKIVNITIDTLDYKDNNGRLVRVGVGFNLTGSDAFGDSGGYSGYSSGSSNSGFGGGASTQPSKSGPRLPGESMEDYLKRRRASEVGH